MQGYKNEKKEPVTYKSNKSDMSKTWVLHDGKRFIHKSLFEFLECKICHRNYYN